MCDVADKIPPDDALVAPFFGNLLFNYLFYSETKYRVPHPGQDIDLCTDASNWDLKH